MEESKSLISLQIAGLMIQNSFRLLLNALNSYYRRKTIKYYVMWRHKTVVLPKSSQVSIKNSVIVLNSTLAKLHKTFQSRTRKTMQDVVYKIVFAAKSIEIGQEYLKDEEIIKAKHKNEMKVLNKELKGKQEHQEELEKNLKKLNSREQGFKGKINEMSSKRHEIGRHRNKVAKEKNEEIIEKIEDLKEENSNIKEKIALLEDNINSFIGEMGGLLEYSEEVEKLTEKRKISVKKGKSGKKGRGPLFNLDIAKN